MLPCPAFLPVAGSWRPNLDWRGQSSVGAAATRAMQTVSHTAWQRTNHRFTLAPCVPRVRFVCLLVAAGVRLACRVHRSRSETLPRRLGRSARAPPAGHRRDQSSVEGQTNKKKTWKEEINIIQITSALFSSLLLLYHARHLSFSPPSLVVPGELLVEMRSVRAALRCSSWRSASLCSAAPPHSLASHTSRHRRVSVHRGNSSITYTMSAPAPKVASPPAEEKIDYKNLPPVKLASQTPRHHR